MIGSHDLRRWTRPMARDQGEDASSDGGYQGFLNGNGRQSRQCHLELDTPRFCYCQLMKMLIYLQASEVAVPKSTALVLA